MAKITDMAKVENPLNGSKGNILDPTFWVQNILGVGFIFLVFSIGQMLLNKLFGRGIFGVNPSGTNLVQMQKTADTNVQPQRMVY